MKTRPTRKEIQKAFRKAAPPRRAPLSANAASLFGEAAWDMLLDLYAAHYEGQPVSVSSLCIASAVPSTTALRAIEAMERDGSLARVPDLKDKRRIFLKISDARRAELDAYFDRLGA